MSVSIRLLIYSSTILPTMNCPFLADDLFLSERDASDFLGDRDLPYLALEEEMNRKEEAQETMREEARKSPRERTREDRENTRERRYEL